MIPIYKFECSHFIVVSPHIFGTFLDEYILSCPVDIFLHLFGYSASEGYISIHFTRTALGFKFNVEEHDRDSQRFMTPHISQADQWTLTPEAMRKLILYGFDNGYPQMKLKSPTVDINISSKQTQGKRSFQQGVLIAYLQMKMVRKIRSDGIPVLKHLNELLMVPTKEMVPKGPQEADVHPLDWQSDSSYDSEEYISNQELTEDSTSEVEIPSEESTPLLLKEPVHLFFNEPAPNNQ